MKGKIYYDDRGEILMMTMSEVMDASFIEVEVDEIIPFLSGEYQPSDYFVAWNPFTQSNAVVPRKLKICTRPSPLIMEGDAANQENQLKMSVTVPKQGSKIIVHLRNPLRRDIEVEGEVNLEVFQHDLRVHAATVPLIDTLSPFVVDLPITFEGDEITVGIKTGISHTSFHVHYSQSSMVEMAKAVRPISGSIIDDVTPKELKWIDQLPDSSAIIYMVYDDGVEMVEHLGGGVAYDVKPFVIVAQAGDPDFVLAMRRMAVGERLRCEVDDEVSVFASPSHKDIFAMKAKNQVSAECKHPLIKGGAIEVHSYGDRLVVHNHSDYVGDIVLEANDGKTVTHRYVFSAKDGTSFYMGREHKPSTIKANINGVSWKKGKMVKTKSGNNIATMPFLHLECDGGPSPEPHIEIDLIEYMNAETTGDYDVLIAVGERISVKSNINVTGSAFLLTNDGNIAIDLWKGGEYSFDGSNVFDLSTNIPYHKILIYNEK